MPTEHVLDVMRWILFRTDDESGDLPKRDAASIHTLLAQASPEVRSLLRIVADAAIRDELLRLRDLADSLELDHADLADTIAELNAHALEEQRPLLELRSDSAVGVHGNIGTITNVSMRRDLARVVRWSARTGEGDG